MTQNESEDALAKYHYVSTELHKARAKILRQNGLNNSTYEELREQAAIQVSGMGPAGVTMDDGTHYSSEQTTKLIAARRT